MPLRDALVVATVSGVTTLNVRLPSLLLPLTYFPWQVFLSGALTVAIPSIGVDLRISEADLQWPLTVFSLAYGCTLLLFGRMGDIYGGRILFLAGSAWFAVHRHGLAPNLTAITLFMAMLGLGAAANTPAGIGIIVSHFPPARAGTPRLACWARVSRWGGLLSQSKATWRAIFYVQAALGALFVLLGIIYLPRASSPSTSNSSSSANAKRNASPIPSISLSLSHAQDAQHDKEEQPAEKEAAYLPTLRAASPLYLPALYRTGSPSLHRASVDGRRSRMSLDRTAAGNGGNAGNNNRMSVASWQSLSDSANVTGHKSGESAGKPRSGLFLPTPTLRIEPATGRLSFSLSRPGVLLFLLAVEGEAGGRRGGAEEEDRDREGREGRGEQEGEETLVAAPAPSTLKGKGEGKQGVHEDADEDEQDDLGTHKAARVVLPGARPRTADAKQGRGRKHSDRPRTAPEVERADSLCVPGAEDRGSPTEERRLSGHAARESRLSMHDRGESADRVGEGYYYGERKQGDAGDDGEEEGEGTLYDKGLDWGGALLSTAGIGLLTYSLAASATAPHGFRTPLIIALLVGSIVLLGVFWAVEVWRENRGKSVLMPPSIWRHPRARMPATIGMVFFAWWNFNTLLYLCALYYQQVHLLSPLQTSLRFLPSIITGVATNLAGGWLMNRVAGLPLILGAVTMNMVAALLFSLMEVNSDFWRISLWVMILLAGADLVYPAGTLQVSSAFDNDSKSLAGGIFTVATRLGASIGMAVTTSITTSVSSKFHAAHPDLAPTAPEVLLVGFRAGAWSLFAAAAVSFVIALVGLRGIGIIGSAQEEAEEETPKQAEGLSDGTFVGGV
ncbi:major facilitator superfamily domain-containing protein [Mycena vitilis]|nr:major facilitator superfamily domain-containing protein [Mycena vitilis]